MFGRRKIVVLEWLDGGGFLGLVVCDSLGTVTHAGL